MAISLTSKGLSLNYPTTVTTVNSDSGNHTLSPAPPVGCIMYLRNTGVDYYLVLGGTYLSLTSGGYINKMDTDSSVKLLRVA